MPDPFELGYWARMLGLDVADVTAGDAEWEDLLEPERSRREFLMGWGQADGELRDEALEKLRLKLREIEACPTKSN